MKRFRDRAPLALALLALSGCTSAPPTEAARSGAEEPLPVDPYADATHAGRLAAHMSRFARAVLDEFGDAASIGVLPLVHVVKDAEDPSVTRWSEATAEVLVAALRAHDAGISVRGPADLATSLDDLGLAPMTLNSTSGVRETSDLLGVDVVVTGTIRYRKKSGFEEYFEYEQRAYDVSRQRVHESPKLVLQVDEDAWEDSSIASLDWRVVDRFGYSPAATLDEELRRAYKTLAHRIVRFSDLAGDGAVRTIYIAPADTARYVEEVADLRVMERAYLDALALETEKAQREERPMDWEARVQFEDAELTLTQMRTAIASMEESLRKGPAFRFAERVAHGVFEALDGMLEKRVTRDLGFLGISNPTELDDLRRRLASGGLARDEATRGMLREHGIDVVLQPRLDELGGRYKLTVQVIDLGRGDFRSPQYVSLSERYTEELARLLAVEPYQVQSGRVRTHEASAPLKAATWEETFERARSGVVQLYAESAGSAWSGSGFVVDTDGLIVTNSHVAEGFEDADRVVAILEDGRQVAVDARAPVVANDPFWDLAVVRTAPLPPGTHAFEFAGRDEVRVMTEVAVLGHPKGTSSLSANYGRVSSLEQDVLTSGPGPRRSTMYTCPTRAGSSGSPVILRDGRIAAVHSAGTLGDVRSGGGEQVRTPEDTPVYSELTGFACGAPGWKAQEILAGIE